MEFYAAIKKNKIMTFAGKWVEVEKIMLNEITQTQEVKAQIFSLICRSQSEIRKKEKGTGIP